MSTYLLVVLFIYAFILRSIQLTMRHRQTAWWTRARSLIKLFNTTSINSINLFYLYYPSDHAMSANSLMNKCEVSTSVVIYSFYLLHILLFRLYCWPCDVAKQPHKQLQGLHYVWLGLHYLSCYLFYLLYLLLYWNYSIDFILLYHAVRSIIP